MSLIDDAMSIALEAYAGKSDKAGQAYILHPIRVMMKMASENSMAAALLHDVIEDSSITADDLLKRGIPESVVCAVQCLSRKSNESYADFIERVLQNPLAVEVKLADIEDNLNVLRLSELTSVDLNRVSKYHRAWHRLRSAVCPICN